jgi:hypothetical protein
MSTFVTTSSSLPESLELEHSRDLLSWMDSLLPKSSRRGEVDSKVLTTLIVQAAFGGQG